MSRALQSWKEAATVILAAKASTIRNPRSIIEKSGSSPSSPNDISPPSAMNDMVVLMLERSSRSRFMPSASVFPGGNLAQTDFDRRWGDYFLTKNSDWGKLMDTNLPSVKEGRSRPDLYKKEYNYDSDVPPEVAFRICAIRETFEESGILLYKSNSHKPLKEIEQDTLHMWQSEVNKTESAFMDMCQDLQILPDVWSLFDWSNWLTPTHMPDVSSGRRFDTMFYLACLPECVQQVQDDKEIVSAKVTLAKIS